VKGIFEEQVLMRAAIFLVVASLVALLQARADEPSPAPKAAAESTSVKPGITVVANPAALTAEDKEWLSRGYKLEMKNGEKYFCRREAEIGSRFERKTCNTAVVLREQSEAAADVTRRAQTDRPLSGN
jgi:hypothetical protein